MSRGSEIAIGLVAALLAGVQILIAFTSGDEAPIGFFGLFIFGLFAGCVAAACLFKTGRWLTTRISAGGISLAIAFGVISFLMSDEPMPRRIGKLVGFGALGVACGWYAVTGKYPDDMPMSEFFAQPEKARKKKRRKKKPRRRREYDYE